jgi:hypothetical protein
MKTIDDIPQSFFTQKLRVEQGSSGEFVAMDGVTRAVGHGIDSKDAREDYFNVLAELVPWLTDNTFNDPDILAWKQAVMHEFGWE